MQLIYLQTLHFVIAFMFIINYNGLSELPERYLIIISILIILFGIEGYVNYSIAELDICGLEKHEIFKELPQDIKKQRCQEIFGLGYVFDSMSK